MSLGWCCIFQIVEPCHIIKPSISKPNRQKDHHTTHTKPFVPIDEKPARDVSKETTQERGCTHLSDKLEKQNNDCKVNSYVESIEDDQLDPTEISSDEASWDGKITNAEAPTIDFESRGLDRNVHIADGESMDRKTNADLNDKTWAANVANKLALLYSRVDNQDGETDRDQENTKVLYETSWDKSITKEMSWMNATIDFEGGGLNDDCSEVLFESESESSSSEESETGISSWGEESGSRSSSMGGKAAIYEVEFDRASSRNVDDNDRLAGRGDPSLEFPPEMCSTSHHDMVSGSAETKPAAATSQSNGAAHIL